MAGPLLTAVAPAAIGAVASIWGGKNQSGAARTAASHQTTAMQRAAEIEAQAAREALAFERDREARRQKEFDLTQERNYGIYQDGLRRDDERYQTRRSDLAPYRALGRGSIGQLMKPIPRPQPQGQTIGSLMGGGQ